MDEELGCEAIEKWGISYLFDVLCVYIFLSFILLTILIVKNFNFVHDISFNILSVFDVAYRRHTK